jgi:hypothetical protein
MKITQAEVFEMKAVSFSIYSDYVFLYDECKRKATFRVQEFIGLRGVYESILNPPFFHRMILKLTKSDYEVFSISRKVKENNVLTHSIKVTMSVDLAKEIYKEIG